MRYDWTHDARVDLKGLVTAREDRRAGGSECDGHHRDERRIGSGEHEMWMSEDG